METRATGVEQDEEHEAEMNIDRTLSAESKRQRDGTGNIGAFGKRTGSSDLRFFEGILPESGGEVLSDRSIEEQFSTALDNLESTLADNRNATLNDVMKLEVQLTDPSAAEAIDHVYESRFDDVQLPPRTVVGVCSLPGGANIQLDVIAAEE
ncbi:RidA family protein [Halorubrum sp. DTA98]|uniref:RidA family protein n=1 Tax=Halorubrum sp. DTA98 TaxID=3402163 RepID=UPI003AAFFF1D